MSHNEQQALTVGITCPHYVARQFGWTFDGDHLVDGDGEYVESYSGEPVSKDEFYDVVRGKMGDPVPLRDEFAERVEYVTGHYPEYVEDGRSP